MLYMLDTDTCSYVIRKRPEEVLSAMQVRAQKGDALCVSVITYAELRLGAERSTNSRKYNRAIELFCERLYSISAWDKSAADRFAVVQSRLIRAGTPIGYNDAMIAAHALDKNAVLVTNNHKRFSKVVRLKLDNWVPKKSSRQQN
ncbi:MAG: type II toxin-antitoxin system VapC family toxin [Pseudomonadales bacterium]|nr:type II toxin-antitoxin system VapC family toxin [Pseudomonadales bacterium]MDP7145016.1 type II toxin-antitoxin system VapC family toxin [Pseudomonadales bacterium]MDP7357198.1 type II toxin-antitoxin system VapC family toxin [Pseudomonadales bacterium]MDP7594739.1 type II toxin-antitoxin system VapC family toxin [Pseudomonadales bacterium]HJN50082.1 type II toxin-antitoxin system VapC family toxin [Pseudomonadales bacterium]|tara:strand:+ start:666 stop:1100 length:435 start_codon:yes stop_codon:yes gene_type:complete